MMDANSIEQIWTNCVKNMVSKFWFDWSWRITLFLLPWQTRWFSEAMLFGWPWEEGRMRVYISWLLILVVIFLGKPWKSFEAKYLSGAFFPLSLFLFLASFVATRGNVAALQAVVFWWMQIILLAGFVFTLCVHSVSRSEVMRWFVYSLIPQIALGLLQYVTQMVFGASWLGMAMQDPRQLGVSVLEFGPFRLLRAYGGFPHPNIFAGWLGMGLIASFVLAWESVKKWEAFWFILLSAFFSVALMVTYSRSAWIAVFFSLIFCLLFLWKQDKTWSQFGLVALFAIAVSSSVLVYSEHEFVFSRFDVQGRLEQKSVQERKSGYGEAWNVFLRRPFLGYGPNADLVAASTEEKTNAPVQSVHNVFVLALIDLGLIGVVILSFFVWSGRRIFVQGLPFVLFLVIVGLFDHYLWSYWSGQVLLALLILFCLLPQRQMPEEY